MKVRSLMSTALLALFAAVPAAAQEDAPPPEMTAVEPEAPPEAAEMPMPSEPAESAEPAPEAASAEAAPPDVSSVDAPADSPAPESSDDSAPPEMTSLDDGGSEGESSSSAWAAIGNRFYVSPMFSYSFADTSRGTDDGYGGILSVGKKLTGGLAVELTGFYNRFSHNTPGDNNAAEFYGGGVAALIAPLQRLPDLYGVLAVQYGETSNLPGLVSDYEETVFDVGLGYLFQITDAGSSVRLEGRYRMDAHDEENAGEGGDTEFYEPVINVGLLMPLGGGKQPEVSDNVDTAAVVPVTTGDSDNDGVNDEADQCPGTPAGAIVDARGCENDEDGDGVVDRLDRCPGTPAGTAVNEEGCPAEAGCRTPEPGQAISLDGCATGDTIVLQGVTFEFDQARLTANAKAILDGVGDALMAKPEIRVEVGGHTDSKGSDEYNQRLSDERADAVEQYLAGRGVDAGRMSSRGYGETQPVADNETEEGRELNRRVELKIVE